MPIFARDGVARAAERRNGVALKGGVHDTSTGIRAAWRAMVRDGANYVREEVEFSTDAGTDLASITLIDLQVEKYWVAGTADGSPLIAANNFYGFEHPMSSSQIEAGHATAKLKRLLPLRAGVAEKYSAVIGVAP